jgi:hypothetical protein
MAFVNTAEKFGDEATVDMIITKTITEYCDNYAAKVGTGVFHNCTALAKVDVPKITEIGDVAFGWCSALEALILRGDTVVTLTDAHAFTGSGVDGKTGYVYVPAALVDSYKSATNWSTYAEHFRALEDYTVDGTIEGELDETKI